jgi:hypothetical protein
VMLYRITDETGLQLDVNALAAVLVELMDRKTDA